MIYAENILICLTLPLAITSLFVGGSTRRFIISFISGAVVCLLSAYIGSFVEYMTAGMGSEDYSVFISPIVEEIVKFLPVIFYLLLFEPSNRQLMLVTVGIGAGFATLENSCYILTSGAYSLTYILIRGLAVGVMHLVCMVALSMGLALLRYHKVSSFSGTIGALSLAMSFHALYNLLVSKPGASSYIGYALPIICAVFLYFLFQRFKAFTEM